jgi:hypothetical protein
MRPLLGFKEAVPELASLRWLEIREGNADRMRGGDLEFRCRAMSV